MIGSAQLKLSFFGHYSEYIVYQPTKRLKSESQFISITRLSVWFALERVADRDCYFSGSRAPV